MLGRFIFILVLVPIIELVLLYQLIDRAGIFYALLLVLGTGIIGISLAKKQGMQAWKAVHAQMAGAQNPSQEIVNGVMILIAGAFLMTPGIITDTIGFLLLVPAIRRHLGVFGIRWFKTRTVQTFQTSTWTTSSADFPLDSGDDTEPATVRVINPDKDSE